MFNDIYAPGFYTKNSAWNTAFNSFRSGINTGANASGNMVSPMPAAAPAKQPMNMLDFGATKNVNNTASSWWNNTLGHIPGATSVKNFIFQHPAIGSAWNSAIKPIADFQASTAFGSMSPSQKQQWIMQQAKAYQNQNANKAVATRNQVTQLQKQLPAANNSQPFYNPSAMANAQRLY